MKIKLLISGAVIASVLTIGTVVCAAQPKEQPKNNVATTQAVTEPTPETQPVATEEPAVQTPPAPKPAAKAQSTPPPVKDLRTLAREQYINADTRARLSGRDTWATEEAYFWQCFEDSITRIKTLDPTFQGWDNSTSINKLVSISNGFVQPCDSRDRLRISSQAINLYCTKADDGTGYMRTVEPLNCNWN